MKYAKFAAICGIATVMFTAGAAVSQESFNARAFFDKIQAEGRSLDSRAFFDRLQAEGRSSEDARKLFDRLQAEGRASEPDFDARKLFSRLEAEARTSADTAKLMGSLPSKADCTQTWSSTMRWDQGLFNKLCESQR